MVLEAGDYYFAIGNGAHNALNNVLASKTGSTDGLISVNEGEQISADNAFKWNLGVADVETYSANVENALQLADINKLIPDTCEYTTRNDWSKGWKTVESLTPTEEMMPGLTNSIHSLSENGEAVSWGVDSGLKLVDALKTDENGNYAGVADFDDEIWDKLVDQITLDEAIHYIEFGADDLENIDSVILPRTYMNDGPKKPRVLFRGSCTDKLHGGELLRSCGRQGTGHADQALRIQPSGAEPLRYFHIHDGAGRPRERAALLPESHV